MAKITEIYAREILDSRGDPTLEVTVKVGNFLASSGVPSGASTGTHEACELRDGDKERYGGKGVLQAVQNVNTKLHDLLLGKEVEDLAVIDQLMIDEDGTSNKSRLGANAILGVSLSCARVASILADKPLYQWLHDFYKITKPLALPTPLANLIGGGVHSDSGLDFQEFWIVPGGLANFSAKAQAVSEVVHALAGILQQQKLGSDIGAEGAYSPKVKSMNQVWPLFKEAVNKAGYKLGSEIYFGLDVASSGLYKDGKYLLSLENKTLTNEELMDLYLGWFGQYPIKLIEDPFSEDDWQGWQDFTMRAATILPDLKIIGDDLFTTNVKRLQQGIDQTVANAILIKLNQIGTVTETMNCIKLAQSANYEPIISHRSGETPDDFIADLAVGVGASFIKCGPTVRSERVAKYNRLLAIAKDLEK